MDMGVEASFTLHVGSRDEIPDMCRKIVVGIDSGAFEPSRKTYREIVGKFRATGSTQ